MRPPLQNFCIVLLAVLLCACGSAEDASENPTTATEPTDNDGEVALLVLPGLEASQSLLSVTATTTSALNKTIGTYNASLPATPDLCATESSDCKKIGTNIYRFPSSGYIQTFYGDTGNQSYMTLENTTDDWGEYRVALFVYPTLSTSVAYVNEVYRVAGDSWDNLIDKETGAANAVAFENNTTMYFDKRKETRTTVWSRWIDNQSYPAITLPSTFDDDAWAYDDFSEPTKEAVGDLGGKQDFSSHSTYTITATCNTKKEKSCESADGTEYYTEIPNGDGKLHKSSKARTRKTITYNNGKLKGMTITADTVRIYTVDANGDKTVKAKTSQTYTLKDTISTTTITETITTGDTDADTLTNYSSTRVVASSESKNDKVKTFSYEYTLALEETTASSNAYTGTYDVIYTKTDGTTKEYAYTATLGINGLEYKKKKKNGQSVSKAADSTSVEPTVTLQSVDHFAEHTTPAQHTMTLDSGTLKNATYQGGALVGGTLNGQHVMIGEGYMIFQDAE
jgi:hypothetical protein